MPESLLSQSRILLFGRRMDDLQIQTANHTVDLATTKNETLTAAVPEIDKTATAGQKILVKNNAPAENGLYSADADGNLTRDGDQPSTDSVILVEEGRRNSGSMWTRIRTTNNTHFIFRPVALGRNRQLQDQLPGASFARIYGFSYEGTYYDLPRPVLFLVHGEGELVTQQNRPDPYDSRAPREPSLGGIAAADFAFADDIRVWSYDKADFTIRMDVETGMFEQVLLDMYFDGEGGVSGARVSGARVSGARVSGARVSGARVSGARVAGARVGGPRGDGSD